MVAAQAGMTSSMAAESMKISMRITMSWSISTSTRMPATTIRMKVRWLSALVVATKTMMMKAATIPLMTMTEMTTTKVTKAVTTTLR